MHKAKQYQLKITAKIKMRIKKNYQKLYISIIQEIVNCSLKKVIKVP